MGLLKGILRSAVKAEMTRKKSPDWLNIDSLSMGPVQRDLSIKELAIVPERNILELDEPIEIQEGEKVTFHIGHGKDTESDIYTGKTEKPKAQAGDKLYIFDEELKITGVTEIGSAMGRIKKT